MPTVTLVTSIYTLLLGIAFIYLSTVDCTHNKSKHSRIFTSTELWGLTCIIFLLITRLTPILTNIPFDQDEGMFIAGALRLEAYPVFWAGLDGYSSGPLNYYPLFILNILGLQINYTLLHALAAVLIGIALYLTVKATGGSNAAKLIAASAAIILCNIPNGTFQSYASELPSIVILAGAAIWLFKANRRTWENLLLGLLLGLIPFAKLQGVPIALAMAACALWQEIRNKKVSNLTFLIAGGLIPTAFVVTTALFFGFRDDFIQRYILNNLAYTQTTPGTTKRLFFLYTPFPLWIYVSMGILVGLIVRKPSILLKQRCSECVIILTATILALLAPGNTFYHYTFYLIVPWILLLSFCTIELARSDKKTGPKIAWCSFAIICLVWPYPRIANMDNVTDKLVTYAQVLKQELQIEPNATLGVWGFAPSFYIEWNAKPFSKDTATGNLMSEWPYHEKLREEYKLELESNPPKYYVEAVGAGNTFVNRKIQGVQTWEWLEATLKKDYRIIQESTISRVWERKKL